MLSFVPFALALRSSYNTVIIKHLCVTFALEQIKLLCVAFQKKKSGMMITIYALI
jgi:hypothetical protein